ncbi:MAG TPA: NADH-quinone oxidoreductase subunit L [Chloroflexota bacterium]|jgi:NADH-quinone oxidoreductase subunit L|nr:NADH-quinone oxidoreductase subunit L [Chloroflexota bacterium]
MVQTAATILLLPLLAFVLIVFVTRKNQPLSAWLSIIAMGLSALQAIFLVLPFVMSGGTDHYEWQWLRLLPNGVTQGAPEGFLRLGIGVDALAAIMLVVVTSVSFLVQVYSRSYMIEHGHRDPGYSRFFAYLSLFTFSMLVVVLANNLLFLFIGWELVGLCSYLLIGFWFDRTARRGVHLLPPWVAAKKAFLTTRVGDVGFLIGLIVLWNRGGTLQLDELFAQVEHQTGSLFQASLLGQPVIFWACLCLFAGAVGKSGQFPLHVWLPDAMEGPTPVSALIHAATMVAAGVYLVARTYPLFEASHGALTVVAVIGGFTAIFAATMGLASNDIKRVLAYSTVSQLGYMMLALGAGSLAAGMFHLFTHAFFKALLFLAAGSVIHAVGTNDIGEMGGLRKFMPRTYFTMAIGGLSLAGFPFFSGFWSKDDVLVATANGGGPLLLAFALITVFLTAFYTFRMFFLTFHGQFRGPVEAAIDTHGHPAEIDAETHSAGLHESDFWMTGPLIILAIPAVVIGFWGSPFGNHGFQRLLEGNAFVETSVNLPLAAVSSVLAIAGIGTAWLVYGTRAYVSEPLLRFGALYRIVNRRYYIDEFYMWLIDKVVIGAGYALAIFDRQVLDRIVNGIAAAFAVGGRALRTSQTGRVQNYGLVLFGGMAVIAVVVVLVPLVRP